MPTIIACEECGRKLKVPDHFTARTARCKCGSSLSLDAGAKASSRRQAPETAVTSARPKRKAARPAEPEPEDTGDEHEDRPKKKKKKKKDHVKKAGAGLPAWVWWVSGMAGAILATIAVVLWALSAGYKNQVLGLVIMVPISTVILIASMIISSKLAGGIDFGEVRLAIMKSVILILVTNLLSMVPGGAYLNILVWLLGLMYLFGLDLWECRFLLAINWLMNFWIKLALIGILINSASRDIYDWDPDDGKPPPGFVPGGKGFDIDD